MTCQKRFFVPSVAHWNVPKLQSNHATNLADRQDTSKLKTWFCDALGSGIHDDVSIARAFVFSLSLILTYLSSLTTGQESNFSDLAIGVDEGTTYSDALFWQAEAPNLPVRSLHLAKRLIADRILTLVRSGHIFIDDSPPMPTSSRRVHFFPLRAASNVRHDVLLTRTFVSGAMTFSSSNKTKP